jgi:hypothetical protein
MSQCFNIVYLAGGFTHAPNHGYPVSRKRRQDVLGVGVKLYAIYFQRINVAVLVE